MHEAHRHSYSDKATFLQQAKLWKEQLKSRAAENSHSSAPTSDVSEAEPCSVGVGLRGRTRGVQAAPTGPASRRRPRREAQRGAARRPRGAGSADRAGSPGGR